MPQLHQLKVCWHRTLDRDAAVVMEYRLGIRCGDVVTLRGVSQTIPMYLIDSCQIS